jgi:hypothetical protein
VQIIAVISLNDLANLDEMWSFSAKLKIVNCSDQGSSSAHHHATIHLQNLTGDVACGWISRKKAYDAGHFFCATHSAKGDRAKNYFTF